MHCLRWSLGAMLAAMAMVAAGADAQPTPTTTTPSTDRAAEQTLFRLEDDFARAVVKRDAVGIRRLVAPKWVYSDESGVMERKDGIKAFTTGTDTVREASNANMHALLYANSAVVIGVLQMKGRGPGGPFTRRYRYTDTWVLLDGRWQCVASQDYLMPREKH